MSTGLRSRDAGGGKKDCGALLRGTTIRVSGSVGLSSVHSGFRSQLGGIWHEKK